MRASLWLLMLVTAGCLATPDGAPAGPDASSGDPDHGGAARIDRDSTPATAIPDDDASGVSDAIAVDDECTVEMIEVDIDVRHPWRSDLQVTLHEPGGGQARLHVHDGNDPSDDLVGTYPVTLSPVDSLAAFVALPAAGSWIMQVADVSVDDVGTFESWALHIQCR